MPNQLPVTELMLPAMRDVLAKSNELAAGAYDTSGDLNVMRAQYNTERRYWNEGGPVMRRSWDSTIATPDGDVAVRGHVPAGDHTGHAIVFIHGGGFILGNLDTHDRVMRLLADASGATVIGVDYALSPEAKFPVAIRQCAAVAQHLHRHGADYEIDGASLTFAGDSGGAMLSLATHLYLRDELGGAACIGGLLLFYGLFGLRDSPSRRLLGGPWDGLTPADLDYYMDCYLADPADAASPYVDCLSADLAGTPPAFIAAAELDPLRDDSAALAAMLANHAVAHRHVVYPGVLHAFLHNSRLLPTAVEAIRDGATFHRDVILTAQRSDPRQSTD